VNAEFTHACICGTLLKLVVNFTAVAPHATSRSQTSR